MTDLSKSILILRLSSFGDVLHTLPAVAALRLSLPSSTGLGWVVEKPFRDLVSLVSAADHVFVADTRRWRRSPSGVARELASLRKGLRAFSIGGTSIDFQGLVKSAVLGQVAGAATRYGFNSEAVREKLSVLFTNRRIRVDRTKHVIDWNLALARAAGCAAESPPLDFTRFEDDPSGALKALVASPTVVINPGAGHPSKMWPVSSFVELVRNIKLKGMYDPMVIWGPGERSRAEEISRASNARLAPQTSFRELAYLLRRASLMISGDTGPIHLAAAIGTPAIGLYGPTNPRRNGPYGQIDHCVESWSSTRLMTSIQVREVLQMMERMGQ